MFLSKHGFALKKSDLSNDELFKLKKELIGKPLIDNKYNFNNSDTTYPVYFETQNNIYIPKMYGIQKYGLNNTTLLDNYNGHSWNDSIVFIGKLYDNQLEPSNQLYNSCLTKYGGILQLQTGAGKTFCTLYVLSLLKAKTIIIVNKVQLMNQWITEIQKWLPHARIGKIQGSTMDIEDKDIVIGMLQSLSRFNYSNSIFDSFKCTVIDEIHNISSKVFSKVLFKICSLYTIGLSATPKRSDGCEYIFKWHIGDIVYKGTDTRNGKPPIIQLIKLDSNLYKEIFTINKFTNEKQLQYVSMLNELVLMENRNLFIIHLLKNIFLKEPHRKILLLSDRRNHLQLLHSILEKDSSINFTYGLFIGGMTNEELNHSRSTQLILATFSIFSEGISEKDLNTLILTTPKKFIGHMQQYTLKNDNGKLEQIVGRIFRKDHLDYNPLIIDLFDNFSIYKSHSNTRKIFYKNLFTNANFQDLSVNLDNNNQFHIITKKNKISTSNNTTIDQFCILD